MNLFSIGTNGMNKTTAASSNKQSTGTGEDFLSFLSKAAESDKTVQEKPKTETAEKKEPKDKAENVSKEENGKNEQVESETKDETATLDESQTSCEENVMAAYINQMAITPLQINRNMTNLEENVELAAVNVQTEVVENEVVVQETGSNLQQNVNQNNLQNQMLNYLNSNLTEEQQVQRLNVVNALGTEEQEVVVEEVVRVAKNENEENPLLQKQEMVQEIDVVEEVVVTQPTQLAQAAEGQVQIQVSDSSTLIQTQPAVQVADKILVNIQNGVQEFNMTLNPEKLGQVAVKMVIENGVVNLHVQVQNVTAQSALTAGLGELRTLLENNNLQVAEIEISMYSGEEQQEREAAQQENRKGQSRYQTEGIVEEEIFSEEEQVVMETSELDYSV